MIAMRAKMRVSKVDKHSETSETLHFHCVAKSDGYPADGSDENNTFAKFSPSGECRINVMNPNLIGKFTVGEEYYIDFTRAS